MSHVVLCSFYPTINSSWAGGLPARIILQTFSYNLASESRGHSGGSDTRNITTGSGSVWLSSHSIRQYVLFLSIFFRQLLFQDQDQENGFKHTSFVVSYTCPFLFSLSSLSIFFSCKILWFNLTSFAAAYKGKSLNRLFAHNLKWHWTSDHGCKKTLFYAFSFIIKNNKRTRTTK